MWLMDHYDTAVCLRHLLVATVLWRSDICSQSTLEVWTLSHAAAIKAGEVPSKSEPETSILVISFIKQPRENQACGLSVVRCTTPSACSECWAPAVGCCWPFSELGCLLVCPVTLAACLAAQAMLLCMCSWEIGGAQATISIICTLPLVARPFRWSSDTWVSITEHRFCFNRAFRPSHLEQALENNCCYSKRLCIILSFLLPLPSPLIRINASAHRKGLLPTSFTFLRKCWGKSDQGNY